MEQIKTLRWPLVALSLLVTLGVLYAGGHAVRATTQDGPAGSFLSAQPAVQEYRLEQSTGEGRRIQVTLKDVLDLAETYRGLDAGVRRTLNGSRYTLALADRRTPALSETFYRLNPIVQEALATGRYGGLVEQVESRTAGRGVDRVRVSMDAERVYVQLHTGADYLYEVYRRPDAPRPMPAESNGGWNF